MSRIKFTISLKKVALINTPKGKMEVGTIEQYDTKDNEIDITLRLNDNLPKELKEALEKNPAAINIVNIPQAPTNILIIPTLEELK